MEIQVNISVRNPEWYWKDDDYQETWIAINGDKIPKYSPMISFKVDAEIQQYIKGELDRYTFKVKATAQSAGLYREVLINDLDVTEFIHAEGSTPVIVSKSILQGVMAAQNNGTGRFYWYYFIKEDADFVQVESNIWLSRVHFDYLQECSK